MIDCAFVSKEFRGLGSRIQALSRVDLRVNAGEMVGLEGGNGAGKTTLLLLLLGSLRATSGTITVLGVPPGDPERRSDLGWMPDRPIFEPHSTGRQFCHWWLEGHRVTRSEAADRVVGFARDFGLAADFERPIGQYSYGMKRKLSFGLAVIHRPRLVLLDEPYLGLDHDSLTQVHSYCRSLRDRGATLLIASHQKNELSKIVDRVLTLQRGVVRNGAA